MVLSLIFLLVSTCIFATSAFLLQMLHFEPWKIQLILKSRYPTLSPTLCKFGYCLTVIYIYIPFALAICYTFYYARSELKLDMVKSLCPGLFIMRLYATYLQNGHADCIHWNVGKTYAALHCIISLLFFSFQILAGIFVLKCEASCYTAVFLGLNSFLCPVYSIINERKKKIAFDQFCNEFMIFLEEGSKPKRITLPAIENNLSKNQNDLSISSSIPDEKVIGEVENVMILRKDSLLEQNDIPPLDLGLINDLSASRSPTPNGNPPVLNINGGFQSAGKQHKTEPPNKALFKTDPKAVLEAILTNASKCDTWEGWGLLTKISMYFLTLVLYGLAQM